MIMPTYHHPGTLIISKPDVTDAKVPAEADRLVSQRFPTMYAVVAQAAAREQGVGWLAWIETQESTREKPQFKLWTE